MKAYLKKLVSLESTEKNVKARKNIIRYIQDRYKGKVFTKTFTRNNVDSLIIAFSKRSLLRPKVTFHGHLDVVAGRPSHFTLKETKDAFIGRGVQDMKGACAVFMTLIDELIKSKKKPDINFLFTTDEEVGGFDGVGFAVKMGLRPRFVITGESTDLQVGYRAKGVLWIKLTAKGSTAHAAYLYNGKNAVVILMEAVRRILKKFPIPKEQSEELTVNVSYIQTENNTTNKVPNFAQAMLDIRYFKGKEELMKLFKSLPPEVSYEVIEDEPPVECDKNSQFIDKLTKSQREITGVKSELVSKFGTSDLRHFSRVGVEGIEYGPIGSGLHSDNEQVNKKSLDDYKKSLMEFINSI